jgi:CBS domain-containing protein
LELDDRQRKGDANVTGEQEHQTLCRDVMSEGPICCVPTDAVDLVAQVMVTKDIGALPVVESLQTMRVIGIVTDRDLATKVVAEGRNPAATAVQEVMTSAPIACQPEEPVEVALKAMADSQVRRVLIIDAHRRLVGIIAQADVATRLGARQKTAQVVEEISKSETDGEPESKGSEDIV